MNLDINGLNEENIKKTEEAIAFFKANKERIKKITDDAREIMVETQKW